MFFKTSFLLIFQFLLEINLITSFTTTPPTPAPLASQNCDQFTTQTEKWFTFNGMTNCYYRSTSSYNSWHQANDFCRSKGANLASIHSYNMNYYLSNRDTSFYNFYYWIGLNSLSKRGVYKWTDGSEVEYTNFANITATGDLIPTNVMDQGRCVSFKSMPKASYYSKKNLGLWFKEDCNSYRSFMCEKSTDTSVQPTSPPPSGNCPPDWFQFANQKCIKYMKGPLSFNDSRKNCIKQNGELLSIHSEEEQNFITAYTADKPQPYIGFRKTQYYSSWSWDNNMKTDYTNWGIYRSYNYYKDNCAIIITNSSQPGAWARVTCTDKHAFLCEKALDPAITTPSVTAITDKCKIGGFDNFVEYRNSCYSLIDSDSKKYLTFADAEKGCQALKGAHLTSIIDPFEEAFLRFLVKQYGKSDMYWIGLQSKLDSDTSVSQNVSQVFEWTDDWPVYDTYWDKYEPQFAGLPQEECVTFAKDNGTWRTTMCDTNNAYICKTTKNQLPKMNTDKSGVCPTLFNATDQSLLWLNMDKRSQYCYWFSVDRKGYYNGLQSWSDASFYCRRRNGTLASLHSSHEINLLKKKLSKMPSTYTTYNTWIGLSTDSNGNYGWEDGSALDYTNWDPNEKIVSKTTDWSDDSGHRCVEIISVDGMWRQQPCSGSKRNYFVCGIKKIYKGDSLNAQQNESKNGGITGGAKAGIAFGVIGGVAVIAAIGYFVMKRKGSNNSVAPSFSNSLYASKRGNQSNSS